MLLCDQRQSDLLRRNEAKERRNADNDALKFEMLKAWGTVLDPSRFSVCCHSPLVSSKRLRALTVVIMDPSFYKVVAFISFITLGWCLRKFNVLKPEAFQAISGLVMAFSPTSPFSLWPFFGRYVLRIKMNGIFAGSIPAASRSDLLPCPMFRRFSRRADW